MLLLRLALTTLALSSPGFALSPGGLPTDRATVLFVDASAPSGGSGSTWGDAFHDLQDALALARAGGVDEIWIAAGTYLPTSTGIVTESFALVEGVGLYGGFAGDETSREERDPSANVAVLSGDLAGDDQPDFVNYTENSNRVVVAGAGITPRTVVDGVTIKSGFARIAGLFGFSGAGLYVTGEGMTIRNVEFIDNLAIGAPGGGSGLLVARGAEVEVFDSRFEGNGSPSRPHLSNNTKTGGAVRVLRSRATFVRCEFEDNAAIGGGGIHVEEGFLTVVDSTFRNNQWNSGAAINVDDAQLTLSGSTFTNNKATAGIVRVFESSLPSHVSNCVFDSNTATAGGGIQFLVNTAVMTCVDSVFRSNTSTRGAGIDNDDSSLVVERCVFEDNVFVAGGGIHHLGEGYTLDVRRSIFRANLLNPNAGLGKAGGGIAIRGGSAAGSTVVIEDSVFAGNDRRQVELAQEGDVLLDGCTLYRPVGLQLVYVDTGGTMRIENSILWNPLGTSAFGIKGSGAVTIDHSCVVGGASGTGNISVDPMLADPPNGDYSLLAGSPCIDAGDPTSVPLRLDLDGDPRVLDGGLNGVVARDMGADEVSPLRLSAVAATPGSVTVSTSGTAGLPTILIGGSPGSGAFLPRAGTLFIDTTEPFATAAWGSVPTTRTVEVPANLGSPLQLQALAVGGAGRALSNPVLLP